MKFNQTISLREISKYLKAELIGNPDISVKGINEIHVVEKGDIVFVDHPKYYDKALNSAATIILINKKVECPQGKALLISNDPFRDFNKLTTRFNPFKKADKSIATTAKIGEGTIIQPNVFIGNNVTIGTNCKIYPSVVIYDDIKIGNNVTIHAGTILGADAFYYKNRPEGFDQLISGGNVIIEDNVSIGAACTIDRGVSGDTTIKEGSKLDNQIQIGHDTVIGKKCLIASQVGISGCCIIEDEVTIWGQAGISSGLTIGKKATILGQTGISKSLEGDKIYLGSPADEARTKFKEMVYVKNFVKNNKNNNKF